MSLLIEQRSQNSSVHIDTTVSGATDRKLIIGGLFIIIIGSATAFALRDRLPRWDRHQVKLVAGSMLALIATAMLIKLTIEITQNSG